MAHRGGTGLRLPGCNIQSLPHGRTRRRRSDLHRSGDPGRSRCHSASGSREGAWHAGAKHCERGTVSLRDDRRLFVAVRQGTKGKERNNDRRTKPADDAAIELLDKWCTVNLLHIITSVNPAGGGPIEAVKQLGTTLVSQGHRV